MQTSNIVLNNKQGWHKMQQIIASNLHNINRVKETSIAQLKRKAISMQLAHYLATWSNEADLAGYLVYLPEEQAVLFLDYDDPKYTSGIICIPIHEFTSSGALQLMPSPTNYRDIIAVGCLATLIKICEQYTDNFLKQ